MTRAWLAALLLLSACAGGGPRPVAIDVKNDACRHCRMIVSDVRLAAEIVAPGEDALIFDDIGCLRDYLASTPLAQDAVVFVADHRTGEWVPAARAVFTKATAVSTPMGSGIIAHADSQSRDRDPAAAGGVPVDGRFAGGTR